MRAAPGELAPLVFVWWQGLPMGGKNDLATILDSTTAQAQAACFGWYGLCLEWGVLCLIAARADAGGED